MLLLRAVEKGDRRIPQLTIKTGLTTPDGREELITEYFCDHRGCPNIATRVLGCVAELGLVAVMCEDHSPKLSANGRAVNRVIGRQCFATDSSPKTRRRQTASFLNRSQVKASPAKKALPTPPTVSSNSYLARGGCPSLC